jgi:hypothetical protein
VASILALLLCACSCAFAQLPPGQKEGGPTADQQPPAADQRGTDATPVVVKLQPAAKTDAEATDEQHRNEQQAADRQLTRRLAILTLVVSVLQIAGLAFQIGLLNRQNDLFAFGVVTPAVEAAIRKGSKLVVFGRIEYRDTFNDTHYTDFSFVWDTFKEGISGAGDFHIHPDGYIDAT